MAFLRRRLQVGRSGATVTEELIALPPVASTPDARAPGAWTPVASTLGAWTPVAGAAAVAALALAGGCFDGDEPGNHAPAIDSLCAEPAWVLTDSVARAIALASDRDGDRLLFRWTATAGEFLSGIDRDSACWRAPSQAGICTLSVLVSDGNDLDRGRLMVPVLDPDPRLALEPHALEFPAGVTAARLLIRNAGTGTLSWSLAANVAWLHLEPVDGTTAGETDTIAVTVDRYGLASASHAGRITVGGSGGSDSVSVSLSVVPPPVYGYTVLHAYPHDPGAFTQGLVYKDGFLYEGTGRHGESSLREVELETGAVLRQCDLNERYFGEGIAILGERIHQLTLSHHLGFIYDRATFEPVGEFAYPTDGWGLTDDGARLILSEGSERLFYIDAGSFACTETLWVRDLDQPVRVINELEWVRGEIYANIWMSNRIARISPRSGEVLGWIDLTGLLGPGLPVPPNVLNGIAYDEAGDRLFVTGKCWPTLFEIELVPLPNPRCSAAPCRYARFGALTNWTPTAAARHMIPATTNASR